MEEDWKTELKQIVKTHQEARLKFQKDLLSASNEAENFHRGVIAPAFRAVRDEWWKMGVSYNAHIRLANELPGDSLVSFKENERPLLNFGIRITPLSTGVWLEPTVVEFIKGAATQRPVIMHSYRAVDWAERDLITVILQEIKTTLARELTEPI